MATKHVVVIGGGISGLTAAYRLLQADESGQDKIECTVCEQAERFGGKIHTQESPDYLLELGPDSIYTRKQGGYELVQELGLEEDIVPVQSGGGTLILKGGHLIPLPAGFGMGVPSDLGAFAKTDLLSLEGKRRALEDLFLPPEDISKDVSLGQLLRRRLGDELVDMISTPLLAGIHAGELDRMSLEATMPALGRLFQEHDSLILGALAMMQNVPRGSAPTKPMFINLQGGLEQLVRRLVEVVRDYATLSLETTVTSIQPIDHGRYDVTIVKGGVEEHLIADAIVLGAPANVAAQLLQGCNVNTEDFESIRYASTATVSFGYSTDPGIHRINSSGYLVPRNQGTPVTACTVVSKKWSHSSKSGKTLVRCYVGHDGADDVVDLDDDTLISMVREHLSQTLGVTTPPDYTVVKRWYHAMPQYDVGHKARLERIEKALHDVPGIVVAGAAYYGVGIPDCISSASRAVEQVTAHLASSSQHINA